MFSHEIFLSYEQAQADIARLVQDLSAAILKNAIEDNFTINAVVSGITAEAHELQSALNSFFKENLHLYRVRDAYKHDDNSFMLYLGATDMHEALCFF